MINTFRKKSVLFIEDDVNLLDMYGELFKKNGAKVYKTISGKNGVELAVKIVPNLIITGILLPYKNGLDVISEIKNNPKTKDVPIIAVSGVRNKNIIKEAMKIGASLYLDKSQASLSILLETAKSLLV